jgi:hypothetical protein
VFSSFLSASAAKNMPVRGAARKMLSLAADPLMIGVWQLSDNPRIVGVLAFILHILPSEKALGIASSLGGSHFKR